MNPIIIEQFVMHERDYVTSWSSIKYISTHKLEKFILQCLSDCKDFDSRISLRSLHSYLTFSQYKKLHKVECTDKEIDLALINLINTKKVRLFGLRYEITDPVSKINSIGIYRLANEFGWSIFLYE